MSVRRRIFADSVWLSFANYIAYGLSFISGLIVRSVLGPKAYGTYHMLSIVESYASYSSFGVVRGAEKLIPFLEGRGDYELKKRISESAVHFVAFSAVFAGVLAFVLTLLFPLTERPMRTSLRVFCIAIALKQLYNILLVLLRAEKKFRSVSLNTVLMALVSTVLTVALSSYWGLAGTVSGYSISLLLMIMYTVHNCGVQFGRMPEWALVWRLIGAGWRLLVVTLLYTTFIGIDRMFIAGTLGVTEVGHYSIAIMAFNLGLAIPTQVGVVLWPRLLEAYGRSGRAEGAGDIFLKSTKLLGLTSPIYVAGLYVCLPTLVSRLLPSYVPGIDAFKSMLPGLAFAAISNVGGQFLVTVNKEGHLMRIRIVSIVFAAVLIGMVLGLGHGIEGVAAAMSASYCLDSMLVTYCCLAVLCHPRMLAARVLVFVYGPSLLLTLPLVVANRLHPKGLITDSTFRCFVWGLFSIVGVWLYTLAMRNAVCRDTLMFAGGWILKRTGSRSTRSSR